MPKDSKEVIYTKKDGIARVSINRPKVLNAFGSITINEMRAAFQDAWDDNEIGVVVMGGRGHFSVGGDIKARGRGGYNDASGTPRLLVTHLHRLIREIPKPVIAMVDGYAIGGGNVLQVLCDLTIASTRAEFGQAGSKYGSFDGGFGSIYLARVVGEKKAREMWYLSRRYSAQEALEMRLVNKVVEPEQLEEEVMSWANELLQQSPTALRFLKQAFNSDTDHVYGIQNLAHGATALYYDTDECREGTNAFLEKREPDYTRFRKHPW